jgi:N-acetylated-alpha-linked acidic dipeptidase
MANVGVLPLQFGALADTLNGYAQELHKLADDKRKRSEELAKLLEQKAFSLATDPTKTVLPPAREPEVPYLDFSSLDNAVARLEKAAKAYDDVYGGNAASLTDAERKELKSLLRGLEQTLTATQGLPR